MLGLTQKERDIAEVERLLGSLPEVPAKDLELDNRCIALSGRLSAAVACNSFQVDAIRHEYQTAVAERDNQRKAIERVRETNLNQVALINNKYIHPVADRLLKRMQQTNKLTNTKKVRESQDIFTDRKKTTYKTNETTIQDIVDRIEKDRKEIMGMRRASLRDVFARIDRHEQWFRRLDFEDIEQPQAEVEIVGNLPKWARAD